MDFCKFLPSVAVPVDTADRLQVIAELEGVTLSRVIREALEGFALGYDTTASPIPSWPPAR